jgi:hypothetical protein
MRIDTASGQIRLLPTEQTVGAISFTLCADGSCEVTFPRGRIRVTDVVTSSDFRIWTAVVDFAASGEVLRRRLLQIGGGDGLLQIVDSPRGDLEAMFWRDPISGFRQLAIAASSGVDARFRPVTFISADHFDPAFSANGAWLYYSTRDPLTGFAQLFRVAAE